MNVTFIFLLENLRGHFEGNSSLLYVVTIFLSLNIFIELIFNLYLRIILTMPFEFVQMEYQRHDLIIYFDIYLLSTRCLDLAKPKKKWNLIIILCNITVWLFFIPFDSQTSIHVLCKRMGSLLWMLIKAGSDLAIAENK